MASRVSYEKSMRDKSAADQKGLYAIDLINANKTPGKHGGRMTMQGPASAEDYTVVSRFMLKFMKARAARNK